jgi:hypothetical protein
VLHGVLPPTPRPVDPHDHRMWAVIGVYHGQEDNQLFARVDDPLEPTERFSLRARDVPVLDASTIDFGAGRRWPLRGRGPRRRRRPVRVTPQHVA